MSHKLINLSERIFNTPQLISYPNMIAITDYITARNNGGFELAVNAPNTEMKEEEDNFTYFAAKNIGVLPITGTLTNMPVQTLCGDGGTSYCQLEEDFEDLIGMGAKTIVLDIKSGGGEAYGAFEGALNCRQMADDANVKIVAYVDGVAASAAYAWACIADEIISNPMSEVGSIGVVTKLVNTNRMDKEDGIDTTYLYAGDSKIPFDPEGNFRADFLDDIQGKIDAVYDTFASLVSQQRNISLEDVKATQAKTFLAPQALENGLIDKVMTKKQFTTYLFGN